MADPETRRIRGSVAYQSGVSAEESVARDYERRGFRAAGKRWRGPGGEIDLIMRNADELVFVEVKKSRSFEQAAWRITPAQTRRIYASASAFMAHEPRGSLTPARFDVALVNGSGEVQVIENAFGGE